MFLSTFPYYRPARQYKEFGPTYQRYWPVYRTHAIWYPFRSLYNHAWNRVRNYSGGGSEMGVGLNEAKHWHRRVYGGLVSCMYFGIHTSLNYVLQGNATQMLPEELGHAAAYEAYRTWMHNSSIYEPLSGDVERQREGLIGLAIAEGDISVQLAHVAFLT
jgi:hypothetical protein